MTGAIRSGRVSVVASGNKTVILGKFSAAHMAMYRFTNGGKDGTAVTINERLANGTLSPLHTLEWGDSVDVAVSDKSIVVQAGAKDAEVVFDFLGLT
jgi:hypothetical protein